MVDWFGNWHEEADYSNYPEAKWCDYDHLAVKIRQSGYKPLTPMENLCTNIFAYFGNDEKDVYPDTPEGWWSFVEDSGGLKEFDYIP